MIRSVSYTHLDVYKRQEVISIHLGLYSDGVPLEEVLPGQDRLMQEFEMQQMLHDLASHKMCIRDRSMAVTTVPRANISISVIAGRLVMPM